MELVDTAKIDFGIEQRMSSGLQIIFSGKISQSTTLSLAAVGAASGATATATTKIM